MADTEEPALPFSAAQIGRTYNETFAGNWEFVPITDAELQAVYGGVGGAGYQRVVDEIERRVAACPAYP